MRHRRVMIWGTASLIAGLAAAATTLRIDGHTAAEAVVSWLAGEPGRTGGTMTADRGGTAAGRPRASAARADGSLGLTPRTATLTPYRLDHRLSPRDLRVAPGEALALDWSGASVSDGSGEAVVSVGDDPTLGTTAAVVAPDPTATATLDRGASVSPFYTGGGSAASQAPSGGGGGLPSAGGSTGGGGGTGGATGGGGGTGGGATGGGGTGGGGTGGGATVPEPATWFLMVAGFGLIGAGQRRRGRADYSGCPANSASR